MRASDSSFRELLGDLARLYREAVQLDLARGLDPRPGLYPGPHEFVDPSVELPLSVELNRTIGRVCDVFQATLDGADRKRPRPADAVSAKRKAAQKAVLERQGLNPTAVAFFHGMTTDGVQKLRRRHGLDPGTGLPSQLDRSMPA